MTLISQLVSSSQFQVEQFIESIFPTQDPKKLALLQKTEADVPDEIKAAEDSTTSADIFFLALAVIGTLFVISGLMVRPLPLPATLN